MGATDPQSALDLQEQITRIDHLIAQTQKAQADIEKGRLDLSKGQWEVLKISKDLQHQPWQMLAGGLTAGAALFAAGAAFIKLIGG